MAQVDSSVVSKLRKAIVNICGYPRGCRKFSDLLEKAIVPKISVEEGKELYRIIGNALDQHIFDSANNYFDSEPPFQLENVILSGSHSEGMQKINVKTGTISDTDFMLILKNIKFTEENQRQGNLSFKENSVFVNLYLTDQDLINTWVEFLETSNETQSEKKTALSSIKLKERFRKKYIEFGPFLTPLNKEDVKEADEGPSIQVASHLPGTTKMTRRQLSPFPDEVFDFVLAIECEGWPICAEEWPLRLRRWPNQDIVHNIMRDGFHIFCKSSSEGDFRLSFSNAETLLIQNLSDLQHKTYRAFKSFIGHYKNSWSPNIKKTLCSYHLKTIVLWYCEKSDPKDWREDTVVRHLLSLIDQLIKALKEHSLPMYFMPECNLMEKVGDGIEVAGKIEELRFNLQLISDAITSEEVSITDMLIFLLRYGATFACYFQFLKKGIKKGKFEENDFVDHFNESMKPIDEFWLSAAGKVPTRNEKQGENFLKAVVGPFMKYLNALFKCSD